MTWIMPQTRTEEILGQGIKWEAVEAAGIERLQFLLAARDEREYLVTVKDIALEGLWSAGYEWLLLTRSMLEDAAAAVSCPRDADLVRAAAATWYEPMGREEWERLAAVFRCGPRSRPGSRPSSPLGSGPGTAPRCRPRRTHGRRPHNGAPVGARTRVRRPDGARG